MINNVVIMGRLTATPELKKTPSDVALTKFCVAVERNYKSGEEKISDFINVTAWRGTAEFVCKYFQKGQMIAVVGSIQTGSYEKDDEKRYTFEVVAEKVSFCSSKVNNTSTTENATQGEIKTVEDASENDLPF